MEQELKMFSAQKTLSAYFVDEVVVMQTIEVRCIECFHNIF